MDHLETPQFSNPSTTHESELDHLDFAAERARIMLGCYRKGEANDPATYSTAVAALLAQYEREVIQEVTHPLSGLPSQTDFMPTLRELKGACELEANRLNRIRNSRPVHLHKITYVKPAVVQPGHEELMKKHGRFLGVFERPGDKWNPSIPSEFKS
jgi:hypothetical protein